MRIAGCDTAHRATRAKAHRREVVTELVRLISEICCRARAKSAARTIPPTFQGVVVEQRARMGSSRAHRDRRAATAKGHRDECVAHFACIVADVVFGCGAQPTGGTKPPTHHRRVVEQRAGVLPTGGERDRAPPRAE